eukprot:TRINITY_DN66284_c5_g1_i1.p1 TRINITY_DN66284_c5_g1~~TRINITY_DN66284_c5_g1_i1.p1  ORF type:complete len:1000 (+),score=50.55 TRINITY_DN66284_c5_g1_i1:48-3047(+)
MRCQADSSVVTTNLPKVVAQILPTHETSSLVVSENKLVLTPPEGAAKAARTFLFDRIFSAQQRLKEHAFPTLAKEAVENTMAGLNTCLFNHGWRSSSLLHADFVRPVADTLFKSIHTMYKAQTSHHLASYRVQCTLIEIVNDKIRDLFAEGKYLDLVHVKEDLNRGTFCTEAVSRWAADAGQLVHTITTAAKNRSPPTGGGQSHLICRISVRKGTKQVMQLREQATETNSVLMLCDFHLLLSAQSATPADWEEYEKTGVGSLHTFAKALFDAEQAGRREPPSVDTSPYPPEPPAPPAPTAPPEGLPRPPSFGRPGLTPARSGGELLPPPHPPANAPGRRRSRASFSADPNAPGRPPRMGHGDKNNTGSRTATPVHSPQRDTKIFTPPDPPEDGSLHYRASLLTWFMKFPLGGNFKTTLFVYIDPSISLFSEALTVLQQSTRLKCITTMGLAMNQKTIKIEEFNKMMVDHKRVQWTEPIPQRPATPPEAVVAQQQNTSRPETVPDATMADLRLDVPAIPRVYKTGTAPRLSWKRPSYKTPKVKYLRVGGGSLQMTISMCSPGDVIIVPAGVYKEPVILSVKDLVLKADRGARVVIETAGNIPSVIFRSAYARLEGFTVIHNGNCEAVLFDKGSGELINCDVTGVCGCVNVQNHCDPLIYGNVLHDSRRGWGVLLNHSKAIVENNDIYGNTDGGIVVERGSNPFVVDNRVHDGKGSGIVVIDNATGTVMENEVFGNACVGVLIQSGGNPVVKGNHIHAGHGSGVSVTDNGKGMIEENEICSNHGHDVEISKMGNPNLLRNKIHDGRSSGLCIFHNGRGYIEQNELWNYDTACITVRDRGNPIVRANTLRCKKEGGEGTSGVLITENGKGEIEDNILIGWPMHDTEGVGGGPIMTKTGGKAKLSNNRYLESELGSSGTLHKKRGSAIDMTGRGFPTDPHASSPTSVTVPKPPTAPHSRYSNNKLTTTKGSRPNTLSAANASPTSANRPTPWLTNRSHHATKR